MNKKATSFPEPAPVKAKVPAPKPATTATATVAQYEALIREYRKKWRLETWCYGNAPAPSRQHHAIHLWLDLEFSKLLREDGAQ